MRIGTIGAATALVSALVLLGPGNGVAEAAAGDTEGDSQVAVRLTPIADVNDGTALAWRRGDPTPYLARQSGQVVPLVDGRAGRPVLDLRSRITDQGKAEGLLGLTFSPDGRHMYVYFNAEATANPSNRASRTPCRQLSPCDSENTLVEYPVKPRSGREGQPVRIAADRGRTLLTIPNRTAQHNGGQIGFGPDGMLYVAVGDGGGRAGTGPGQVPGGNGQSLDTLLGKILRIKPRASAARPYTVPKDNPFAKGGGLPEIWHYGLRNPWRFSFDRATGALWIGDVGENQWEEIDVAPRKARGLNFGYPQVEGTHALNAPAALGTVLPVHELSHRDGYCAVIGGTVYRGRAIPALRGFYVFGDYCTGRLEAIRVRDGAVVAHKTIGTRAPRITSLAQSPRGTLYVVSQQAGVLRVDPR